MVYFNETDFQRHCTISCLATVQKGGTGAYMAGIGNEIEHLLAFLQLVDARDRLLQERQGLDSAPLREQLLGLRDGLRRGVGRPGAADGCALVVAAGRQQHQEERQDETAA